MRATIWSPNRAAAVILEFRNSRTSTGQRRSNVGCLLAQVCLAAAYTSLRARSALRTCALRSSQALDTGLRHRT